MTNNVMVWESNTVARTVEEECCSLIISPDGSKMLDEDSPYITPLEKQNPLNKVEVWTVSCKCK